MEEEELIPTITDIARESPILSVRGYIFTPQYPASYSTFCRTCFFVLGLISSTALGAEVLDDYGWEATTSPLGMPTGLAIPMDLQEFVSVSTFQSKDAPIIERQSPQVPVWESPPTRDKTECRLPPPTNPLERDALTAIYNLGNNVIANAASRTLVRCVSSHRVMGSSSDCCNHFLVSKLGLRPGLSFRIFRYFTGRCTPFRHNGIASLSAATSLSCLIFV